MTETKVPIWFWIVALLLVLWNAMGCYACITQIRLGAAAMGPVDDWSLKYYAALPDWYNGVYAVATFSGMLAAILLLLRNRRAALLFWCSLVAIVVMFGYAFVATDLIAHKGLGQVLPFPLFIAAVGALSIWYVGFAGPQRLAWSLNRHTPMWEGQATTRRSQQVAGLALAVASSPFALFGAWGLGVCIVGGETPFTVAVTATVAALVGFYGLTIAYRIFFGRGVRQGGGVMSPFAYRVGGFAMLALAAFFSYQVIVNGRYQNSPGVLWTLFLAFIFFVAARHRGAMRTIK